MTRNEHIAQTAMLLYVHKTCEHPVGTAYEEAVLGAKMLANMLEHKGCAPWKDAPPVQPAHIGKSCASCGNWERGFCSKLNERVTAHGLCDMHTDYPVEYQNSMIRSKMPQSPGQVIQFDLPTRKEITAADVQPGAVFTLEDGTKHTVTELTTGAIGGSFVRTSTGSANYEVRGKILEPSVGVFVLQMNAANATVTPPTA